MEVPSEEWLKIHGLAANGVSLSQILCSLGFQQRSGDVPCLDHSVTSQYSTGIFLQHPNKTGLVYNLVDANEERLRKIEERVTSVICCLKQRLQWLNSGSRKTCGVLGQRRVLLVLLEDGNSAAREAAVSLLQDQGSFLTHLNIIRGSAQWKQQLVEVQEKAITEAVQWLLNDLTSNDCLKAMLKEAVTHETLDAVYVIAEGSGGIREKVNNLFGEHLSTPVHVAVMDCMCPALLNSCQDLASASGGRCYSNGCKEGALCLPRPDVLDVWQELEQARDTLAQVQALRMEVAEKTKAYYESPTKTAAKKNNSKKKSETDTKKPNSKKKSTCSHQLADCKVKLPQASQRKVTENTCSKGKTTKRRVTVRSNKVCPKQKTHSISQPPLHSLVTGNRVRTPVVGTVLASCKQDGFYYRGNVVRRVSRQSVVVRFLDHSLQTTSVHQLIPVGGAGPCPLLRSKDYVLCCVRQSQGRYCSEYGVCDFYIPAQVQVVPRESESALFSVSTFRGEHVSCTRSSLRKISKTRYLAISSHIAECRQQGTTATGGVASDDVELKTSEGSGIDCHEPSDQAPKNSPPQNEDDSSYQICPEEESPDSVCQHSRDMATAIDVLETVERGTCVSVPTHEQAVGTGPQMVDHSTTTEGDEVTAHTVTEPVFSSSEEGIEGSSRDRVDYSSPPELEVGSRVFCCLPEAAGWYCKASVLGRGATEASCVVSTELGEVADIPITHIIPLSHSSGITVVGSIAMTVLAPHPLDPASFAPGSVRSIDSQRSSFVTFYDGLEAEIPTKVIHPLSATEHRESVIRLRDKDNRWIGQGVIARRDSDGVYYPAVVTEKLERQCYRVKWTDGSFQSQSRLHIFGRLSSRRSLHPGDHVLALAMAGIGACLPGTVTGLQLHNEGKLDIRFSDGERQMVPSDQCFWIDPAYFISAVEYISHSFSQTQLKHAQHH